LAGGEPAMKVKMEVELTPEEFQELFVPGDKQKEFTTRVYDAYTEAFTKFMQRQIDPHGMIWKHDAE